VEHQMPDSLSERLSQDPAQAENYNKYAGNFRIVLSLREDYLPDLENLRSRLQGVMTNRYRLLPMNGTQALDVVLKPAPGLVEEPVAIEIVDRVSRVRSAAGALGATDRKALANRPVEPALLSMVCSELNRKRKELGLRQITPELVDES